MKTSGKKALKPKAARKSKFLVYIDDGEYSKTALKFACNRVADSKHPVEMLYVLEPVDFSSFGAVEEMMRKEHREKARKILTELAAEVNACAGLTPSLVVKEGLPEEQILAALKNDADIGMFIIGIGDKSDNKMLSWLVSHGAKLQMPIMIVPGSLSDERMVEL